MHGTSNRRKQLRISAVVLLIGGVVLAYSIATERVVHAGADSNAGRASTALDIANLPPARANARVVAARTDKQDLDEGKLTTKDLVEGAHGDGDGGIVPQGSSR
jgi:hypothetical protein